MVRLILRGEIPVLFMESLRPPYRYGLYSITDKVSFFTVGILRRLLTNARISYFSRALSLDPWLWV
jgi:hypothetical protein